MRPRTLGVTFSSEDNNSSEVCRFCNTFLGQFSSMHHKLNHFTKDVLKFLFGEYCGSFLGAVSWFESFNKESSIRKIDVTVLVCPYSSIF